MVAVSLLSALTSMTDLRRVVSVLFIEIAALLIANLVYQFLRRRVPRSTLSMQALTVMLCRVTSFRRGRPLRRSMT